MRCRNCNVDLPDSYEICPLCGEKAYEDKPLIDGIKTAEYPKLNVQKSHPEPFYVFAVIWLAIIAVSSVLGALKIITPITAVLCVTISASVWTLIFRPIFVKQLYAGNFIMMNIFPLSMLFIAAEKALCGSVQRSLTSYVPLTVIVLLCALCVLIAVKPKSRKRAVLYPVLLLFVSTAASIIYALTEFKSGIFWYTSALVCVIIISFLFIKDREKVTEELKAKFSVQ